MFSIIIMACIGFIIKASEIILPVVLQGWRGTLCFFINYKPALNPMVTNGTFGNKIPKIRFRYCLNKAYAGTSSG